MNSTAPRNVCGGPAELLHRQVVAAAILSRQVKSAQCQLSRESAPIRKLFGQLAETLASYSRRLRDREGAVGAIASACDAAIHPPRAAAGLDMRGDASMVDAVAGELAAFGDSSRDAIAEAAVLGDAESGDIFTGLSHVLDYDLWLLESLSRMGALRRWR